ncbi:MAG: UvrD-helicase domain-containing protein [Deltaproteobacteria bacterium]|nr:UvrD-helicase domain-containing protein [Deltaproteobacteria bacterium]
MRVASDIPDIREREEALDPSRSFIVQAPAGSGKTELLMQRFLNLLSGAGRPEEILALTFTKKAAGEMQNRVLAALQKVKAGYKAEKPHETRTLELAEKALKRDVELGWGILENPGRLKVQTMDSLSAALVRLTPMLSGMGKELSIADNPDELYREAARRTLLMVEDDGSEGEAVRKALKHLDNSVAGLGRRLVLMLGRRDQWLRHVNRDMAEEDLKGLLEGSLRRLVEYELKNISSSFPEDIIGPLLESARYAAFNLRDEQSEGAKRISVLLDIASLPDASVGALPLWQGIKELLFTAGNELRKPGGVNKNIGFPSDPEGRQRKKEFQGLLESLTGREALLRNLAKIALLPPAHYSGREWEILDALLVLLPIAEGYLMEVFGEEGSIDFQAVSMAALAALGSDEDPTDLMLSLDIKIRHILVDEYQDTSQTQLSLIKSLTRGWARGDGRTLFVVGDPMQSIYLFREAQVGLFIDAKQSGIGDIELASIQLKTNFRSQENIVDWVNGSFEGAFPGQEDVFTGAVTYAPSKAAKPGIEGVSVNIDLFASRDDLSEAVRAVEIIKGIGKSESVAVLCRSRQHLDSIVEALKKEGIGFRAQEFDPLEGRVAIQDLSALLRALSHPYDRVAWLAILRAPWCGLKIEDLHKLCLNDRRSPVWKLLNDAGRMDTLSKDGRERVSMVCGKLEKALSLKGRVAPRVLLEGLWIDLGGPACVRDEASMKDAEAFLSLVGGISSAGELDPLRSIGERVSKLYANYSAAGTNIDLMTIHKAKGLEFDHVVLPGLGKHSKSEEKKLILWMERGADLLLAPIENKAGEESRIYRFLNHINKEKLEHEEKRLFYVAATRAKKALYLLGHIKGNDEDGIEADKRSFLSSISHVLTGAMVVDAAAPEKDEAAEMPLRRLPVFWKAPEPALPLAGPLPHNIISGAEPEFYWAGQNIRHLGTVVHRYLCEIAKAGISAWDGGRINGERARIRSMLMTLGVNRAEADKMGDRAIGIISKAMRDERGRWILEPHEDGAVELPISGIVEGEVIHSVIDRTFVDKGVRWVIDYKAGSHEGGYLEGFLKNEKDRYFRQLERYGALLIAAGEEREIRKGLYYPALSEWVEW